MFDKVLIANRGEIALRITRACREAGIRVVVAHSTADRDSAAVRQADESVQVGPASAAHSYLNTAAMIEAALRTGADAIHPGYGFLSEDADFAEGCRANRITFIGPATDLIRHLGDKTAARALMSKVGLPLLPGNIHPLETNEHAREVAGEVGYPLIIKPAAGGGGRGMRVVNSEDQLDQAYHAAQTHAQLLFGDPRVYIERYVPHARHIEVQILADHHGNVVQLGERDCSVQRRHQKLIEETPAPGIDSRILELMRRKAAEGARAVGYTGAGTFEFLVDDNDRFYFLEVNCRIQVEHPVTEMATGIDIVNQQLRISSDEPLSFSQEDITPNGSVIECRINAEDPTHDFAPAAGILDEFIPAAGPFVRVDTHAFQGYQVPVSYDSLLAKLVVWAPTRELALHRMQRALEEFRISGPGVHTTIGFLNSLLTSPRFRAGTHSTSLVQDVQAALSAVPEPTSPASAITVGPRNATGTITIKES